MNDWVLGRDPHGRIRVQQTLAASGLLTLGGLALLVLGWAGVAPRNLTPLWLAQMVAINTAIYIAIRSGATRHFADPSLTEPQMLHAIVQTTLCYALAGPARGVSLLAVMLTLAFGLFSLSTRRMWHMVGFALLSIGLAIVCGLMLAPEQFNPGVEGANFLVALISLPAVGMLAGRLNRLRERLRGQRLALAEALQRIELLATHDELTGLVNRRQVLELLAQQQQRGVRSGQPFCVAVLDLDHFKRINDQHGHAAGDEVLRSFGRETSAAIRLGDVLARFGGEEFLLLMPDTAAPLARLAVERLRERHAALSVRVGDRELRVTLSAGVTEHRAGEPVADTIARADAALYVAKANGRNRVNTA